LRLILFILFVVVPILEIATFIQMGSLIGLGWTLFSILLTAVIGAFLVRQQGFKALNEARTQSANNEIPVTPVIHGVFILAAGLLLLTPGFVTDAIGFLFLFPPFRLLIAGKVWAWISSNMDVKVMHPGAEPGAPNQPQSGGAGFDNVIDGEAVEVDEGEASKSKPSDGSPWTRINHKDG
jgi:UPF0716 protein FxsA